MFFLYVDRQNPSCYKRKFKDDGGRLIECLNFCGLNCVYTDIKNMLKYPALKDAFKNHKPGSGFKVSKASQRPDYPNCFRLAWAGGSRHRDDLSQWLKWAFPICHSQVLILTYMYNQIVLDIDRCSHCSSSFQHIWLIVQLGKKNVSGAVKPKIS